MAEHPGLSDTPASDAAASAIGAEELERWRHDTPGVAHRIHLNNAGAALMPSPVLDAVTAHLRFEAGIGGYEAAAAAQDGVERTYAALAELVGAAPRNVAIASSATAAWTQAMMAFDFARSDVIVTTNADYISNQLTFLSLAERRGVRVERAADLSEGGVDPGAVRSLVRRLRPKLVALTWVPTSSGLVQPAAAVGDVCAEAGVPYLVDACQAVGQLAVDVTRLRCDYLSATARKFLRGPRGIGFLFVSDRALEKGAHPLLVDMRGAMWTSDDSFALYDGARRFEQWEVPCALVLGLGAAVRYALDAGIARTARRAHVLAADARCRLSAIPGVRSLDEGTALSAIAAFECGARRARDVMLDLRSRGINTTAQERGDALLDLDRKGVRSLLRVSPHYYNAEREIDALEDALRDVLRP